MAKRFRRSVGDIVTIPLPSGKYAFGGVMEEPLMAFFDYQAEETNAEVLEILAGRPVAFTVWVMNHAIKSGRWKVVGKLPQKCLSRERPRFFKQDSITGALSITADGSDEVPAAKRECEALERAAVWEPAHVEDRLVDHFARRPNKWVESLRIR